MRRLLILLAVALAGCRGASDSTLHLYTSLDAQEAPVYIAAFEKETGIRVTWVRLSAGEALARLDAERQNPQVSVWFGGPSPEYMVAAQRGLLEPFQPTLDAPLAPSFHDADWAWTGFYFGVIGFACYQPFLDQQHVSCPNTWQELLQPAFRKQVSIAYPYTSGTAYITLASLLQKFGADSGWAYVRALDQQVHHYNSSGTAAVTQAAVGEVGVGIAFAHDILKKGKERGYPITLSIPRDGAPTEVGAVALVKGGREQAAGQRFINWLLSKGAQDLLAQFYRVPLNPNARVAEGAVQAASVNIIPFDAAQAAAEQKNILAQWRSITGR